MILTDRESFVLCLKRAPETYELEAYAQGMLDGIHDGDDGTRVEDSWTIAKAKEYAEPNDHYTDPERLAYAMGHYRACIARGVRGWGC